MQCTKTMFPSSIQGRKLVSTQPEELRLKSPLYYSKSRSAILVLARLTLKASLYIGLSNSRSGQRLLGSGRIK